MELDEFLELILPDTPAYCVSWGKTQPAHTVGATSKAEAIDIAKAHSRQHVWVAPAGFDDHLPPTDGTFKTPRYGANCLGAKALWLDIDCGDPKDAYASISDGLVALSTSGLPPPSLIVHSGGGLHIYWRMTETLAPVPWVALAEALKDKTKAAGVHADHGATSDIVRLLRPLGSYNYRYTPPRRVRLVLDTGIIYTPARLAGLLVVSNNTAATVSKLNLPPAPSYMRLPPGAVNPAAVPRKDMRTDYDMPAIASRCGVVKDMLSTGGANASEPAWKASLQLAAVCNDGRKWAHELSSGHAQYSRKSTERKYNERLHYRDNAGIGAPTCATFEQEYPSFCDDCPWHGRITTPTDLSQSVNTMLPGGFRRIPGIGIGDWVQDSTGALGGAFFHMDISRCEGFYNTTTRSTLLKLTNCDARKPPVVVNMNLSADMRTIHRQMADCRLIVSPDVIQMKKATDLLVAWTEQLTKADAIQPINDGFGWVYDDNNMMSGFSVGTKTYRPDGRSVDVPVKDENLASCYMPHGSYDMWRKVVQFVERQRRVETAIAIGTALGAPLMELTGERCMAMSFVSDQSGTGKTTALRLAQSIWGEPMRSMSSLDDTSASMHHKAGMIRNLPVVYDEVRLKAEADVFTYALMRFTQGVDKSRMSASMRLQPTGTWSTILMVGANISVRAYAAQTGKEPALMRIMEFEMPPLTGPGDGVAMAPLFRKLDGHYGHAGHIMGKWLAENRAVAEKQVSDCMVMLGNMVQLPPQFRFMVAGCASILAGLRIANVLGIFHYNLHDVATALLAKLVEYSSGSALTASGFDTATEGDKEFVVDNVLAVLAPNLLITDVFKTRSSNAGPVQILWAPAKIENNVKAQISIAASEVRIDEAVFRQTVKDMRMSPAEVIRRMVRNGDAVVGRMLLGGGTNYSAGLVRCVQISLDPATCQAKLPHGVAQNFQARPGKVLPFPATP